MYYNDLTTTQKLYVDSIREIGGEWGYDLTKTDWTRKELVAISMKRQGNDDVPNWIVKDKSRRVGRGLYSIPEVVLDVSPSDAEVGQTDVLAVSPGHEIEGDGLDDSVLTIEDDMDASISICDDMPIKYAVRGAESPCESP
tara:strand:- start:33 stop:455 length:423 start_codon:yes stop_codon:yes gene_type:complete